MATAPTRWLLKQVGEERPIDTSLSRRSLTPIFNRNRLRKKTGEGGVGGEGQGKPAQGCSSEEERTFPIVGVGRRKTMLVILQLILLFPKFYFQTLMLCKFLTKSCVDTLMKKLIGQFIFW